jgi:predicted dienelactone hydrolase
MVQVWYPAPAPAAGTERSLWIRNLDEYKGSPEFTRVAHVRTNSVFEAPVLDGRWPVLIYNHGGGWTRWSGTFTTEMLASHGYVVFAIDHAGFNKTTDFPDGYKFAIDTLGPPKPTNDIAVDAPAFFDWLAQQAFPVWLADSRFVLDQAEALDRDAGPFTGRLDVTKVGALGWSFGGATAVQLTRSDPRVKAAVDQDGQLFDDVKTHGTTRPIMLMHNTSDPAAGVPADKKEAMQRIVAQVRAGDSTAVARSTGPVVEVDITRTGHGHFSDLTFFYPPDSTQLTARRAHEIINGLTLAFFEKHLRGKNVTIPSYPEVIEKPRK